MVGNFAAKNLSSCYSGELGIPCDITINIIRSSSDSEESDEVIGSVEAHKTMLAISSEWFRDKLIRDKNTASVTIRDYDREVVESAVKFCYNVDPKLSKKPLAHLIDLYCFAAEYSFHKLEVN